MESSRETEQPSYFYVVWPEESQPAAAAPAAPTPIRDPSERTARQNGSAHGTAERSHDRGKGCDHSIPDISSMAQQAIVHLQKILEATSNEHLPEVTEDDSSNSPPALKRPCHRPTSNSCAIVQCLECKVKDAEIKTLHRRILALQEQLAVAQHSKPGLHAVDTPSAGSHQNCTTVHQQPRNGELEHRKKPMTNGVKQAATAPQPASESSSTTAGSGEVVELVSGAGIYISVPKLEEALRDAKTGTQLARKLMDAFWDKATLARSSVSARSKFQYEQLDPKVVAAIESYCLAFDRNAHLKDLHATMTDKCCQCRRGSHRILS